MRRPERKALRAGPARQGEQSKSFRQERDKCEKYTNTNDDI